MRFAKPSTELIVFGITITALGSLASTWFVLVRNVTSAHYDLARQYLALTTPDARALELKYQALDERFGRRLLQISGEGATFVVLLLLCVVILFIVARQKRRTTERMERVLQFTTHELKTPIAGVKALLQSMGLGSIPPARLPEMLDRGIGECNRLEHLAEAILAYQRAVARDNARLDRLSPDVLVGEVLEHRSQGHGSEAIHCALAPSEVRVLLDRDAFRVIFENLLDNAKKYGKGSAIDVVTEAHGGRWRLLVRDHGIGFDQARAEALFDPFTRESRAETARQHGSGLGLYISRQLAQRIGGELTAQSEGPNQGATFTLSLPIAEPM